MKIVMECNDRGGLCHPVFEDFGNYNPELMPDYKDEFIMYELERRMMKAYKKSRGLSDYKYIVDRAMDSLDVFIIHFINRNKCYDFKNMIEIYNSLMDAYDAIIMLSKTGYFEDHAEFLYKLNK